MKSNLQTKTVKLYTTADGREFQDKNEALAHQAVANVIAFFQGVLDEAGAQGVLMAIKEDPDGFREVVGPLLRRPRGKRADAGVPRRRGRPPANAGVRAGV